MASQFAGRLALIAFAIAGLQGVLSFADFEGTIRAALAVSAMFYAFGFLIGELGRRIAEAGANADFARIASTPAASSDSQVK